MEGACVSLRGPSLNITVLKLLESTRAPLR